MSRMNATLLTVLIAATAGSCQDITIEGPDREPLEASGEVLSSADDLPISGATVRPCGVFGTQLGRWCGDIVQTAANGRFDIEENVHDSVCPVEIRVSATGFAATTRRLAACPGTTAPMTVTLDPEGA